MKTSILKNDFANSVFLLQPGRPILCTTKNSDGSNHVAPFSWINPVSHKPPRVALALLNNPKKQHSLENIESTGEFVINMPGLELAEKLVESSFLTREGENKFVRSGFTPLPSKMVEPPGIAECKAILECRVINSLNAGDHTLLIADVLYACYEPEAYGPSLIINTEKFQPALHLFNYQLEKAEIHVFLKPSSMHTIEVAYADPELKKKLDGEI